MELSFMYLLFAFLFIIIYAAGLFFFGLLLWSIYHEIKYPPKDTKPGPF